MLYLGIAGAVLLLWLIVTYNKFVTCDRLVGEGWSGISVQLRRRHDLIPALANVVKAYARHESSVFTAIAAARASADDTSRPSPELALAEKKLGTLVTRLVGIAEGYPELKADTQYLHLQKTLAEIEEQLQMARRYYNGTVRNYMVLYESFPSLLLPKIFSFAPHMYFQLDDAAMVTPPQWDAR